MFITLKEHWPLENHKLRIKKYFFSPLNVSCCLTLSAVAWDTSDRPTDNRIQYLRACMLNRKNMVYSETCLERPLPGETTCLDRPRIFSRRTDILI